MNKKGFTVMETIISMYLLSILIAIGMSVIQFTTQSNFSEMKLATSRSELTESILYMQRDFQSAEKIFISDKEYRSEDGTLLPSKTGASTEITRLYITPGTMTPYKYVAYSIIKNFNTKDTTLYFDGEKNGYTNSDGTIPEIDVDGKYICPTKSNRIKDNITNMPIGAFIASLVFYEDYETDLNDIERYNSYGTTDGYGHDEVDFALDNVDEFTDNELIYFGYTEGTDFQTNFETLETEKGVGNVNRDEILKLLEDDKMYSNFKQLKLNLIVEKYNGAKQGNNINLTFSNRLNRPILKCKVIE